MHGGMCSHTRWSTLASYCMTLRVGNLAVQAFLAVARYRLEALLLGRQALGPTVKILAENLRKHTAIFSALVALLKNRRNSHWTAHAMVCRSCYATVRSLVGADAAAMNSCSALASFQSTNATWESTAMLLTSSSSGVSVAIWNAPAAATAGSSSARSRFPSTGLDSMTA